MHQHRSRKWIFPLLISFVALLLAPSIGAQQACFSAAERARAEQTAKVYRTPDPGYDPVLGYNRATGPRRGAPPIDSNGKARPLNCVANKDENPGAGTTPKFHCSVAGVTHEDGDLIRYKIKPHFKGQSTDKRNGEIYGEFLSSRFSKALGFFADDEWVADVRCPDCEKSLTRSYQGASFSGFEPAAGIELSLARGIDVNCNNKDSSSLSDTLTKLLQSGAPRAEVDAFKLWLAFIDHGDTKTDNHKFACLNSKKNADGSRACEPGQAVFYVSDMGSTFGYSRSSENKAKLDVWKKKDPIEASGGRCSPMDYNACSTLKSEIERSRASSMPREMLSAISRRRSGPRNSSARRV